MGGIKTFQNIQGKIGHLFSLSHTGSGGHPPAGWSGPGKRRVQAPQTGSYPVGDDEGNSLEGVCVVILRSAHYTVGMGFKIENGVYKF